MLSPILIPLDGSTLSEAILPHVQRLAAGTSASTVLLAVATLPTVTRVAVELHPVSQYGAARAELDRLVAEERERLTHYLAEMALRLAEQDFAVRTEVREAPLGDVAPVIVRAAQEAGAELIAMSTHGRTGLAQLVHGSVAEAVLRASPTPIMLVRPDPAAFERQQRDQRQG